MSDRDKFIALLEDFGIHYLTEGEHSGGARVMPNEIHIPAGPEPKNDGYGGFFAAAIFDEAGKFVKIGFWE